MLGLRDREVDGVLAARIGVGANEFVLAHAFGTILLDASGGLVLAVRLKRRRLDAVALVFDGGSGRRIGLAGSWTQQAVPSSFKLRQHFCRQSALGAIN